MVLRSLSKNRELQQRRNVGTNVATLQKQSIPTSQRSGSVLGGFLAHFEPIMEGFKAQTGGIEKKDGWEKILGVFEGEQAPFGWKHPRACSWRDF